MTEKEYLKSNSSRCPYCGGGYFVDDYIDSETAHRLSGVVCCDKCNKRWPVTWEISSAYVPELFTDQKF